LECTDGFAKLFTLMHIWDDGIETGAHDTKRAARQNNALVVEAGHEHIYAAPLFANNILKRYKTILENQFTGV